MADAVRFYADQHYPAPVTAGLRRRGIDVLTAQDAGQCGAIDADQLAFATGLGRTLLTLLPQPTRAMRVGGIKGLQCCR